MKPKLSRAANVYVPQGHDLCQTPAYAVAPLLPYLKQFSTIWEPAAGKGRLVQAMRDGGLTVVGSDLDAGRNFFDWQPDSWNTLITNPPYTLKYKWLARCYELGKPFALLVPGEMLFAQSAIALTERYGFEMMILDRRVNFEMPEKGFSGAGAQFPTFWLCHKILPRQVVYGKMPKEKKEGPVAVTLPLFSLT